MSAILASSSSAPAPAASPGGGRLAVEIARDPDLPPDDAASAEALITARPGVGAFLGRAWRSGLFAEPPGGYEPAIATVRDGRMLRGMAVLGIRCAATHTRVTLLGGGAGSDRVDLLAERGFEAACADALIDWLGETFGRRGFVLELRDVAADSALWGAIQRANRERDQRLAFQPRDIHMLPYVDLAEPTTAGGAVRPESLAKHRRWLERRGRQRVDVLGEPGEVMEAFDRLAGLLNARWRGREQASVLDDPRALRFHRRVLPELLREGRLRMIRLSSDARPIAVFYGLALPGWCGYYLAGYDREWAGRIHLGQITLATAMELAARDGALEFDFLKGAERVKYLWPVRERATMDADVYSARSGAQLARAARATREAAVALVRSARHLWKGRDRTRPQGARP